MHFSSDLIFYIILYIIHIILFFNNQNICNDKLMASFECQRTIFYVLRCVIHTNKKHFIFKSNQGRLPVGAMKYRQTWTLESRVSPASRLINIDELLSIHLIRLKHV